MQFVSSWFLKGYPSRTILERCSQNAKRFYKPISKY